MLVLAKVRRGREHYYLASLPREQTDAGLVEELGVWHGAAAAELGLAGRHVEPEQLAQLLSGRAPDGSELDPGHARVDVVAYDCTFTCPKGVSLLERLGPEALAVETRKAHEGAVAATLGYLERHAAVVRRSREGGRVSEGASGLIAAAFLHQASRAPDPHLHTHLLVANLARDDAGRWSALDARPLFLERAAAGALYAAELRSRLGAALGVSWRKEREALDLAGVPRPVSVAFSRRQAAIADELARFGSQSPAAARVASLRTRPPKDRSVSIERLGDVWRERALDLGVAPSRWSRVAPGRPELASGHRLAPAVQAALTSLEVPFSRRSLVAAVARSSTEGAAVEEVETAAAAALEDRTVVVAVSKGAVSMGKGAVKVPGVVEERFATVASLVSHERLRTILASSLALPGDFSFPVAGVVLRQDDETARDELAERSL
ncbi:MAG: hypothetical protein JWM85_150, partial [Acidimicrobiaceae bacterium]|nr:hypothetical protein [Acidimicrobiaceae bacterium]